MDFVRVSFVFSVLDLDGRRVGDDRSAFDMDMILLLMLSRFMVATDLLTSS